MAAEKAKKKTVAKKSELDSALVLDEQSTIQTVHLLKDKLSKALTKKADIVIDASKVTIIDLSNLQLLLSFTNQCKVLNKSFSWHKPAKPLLEAAISMGMDECLSVLKSDKQDKQDKKNSINKDKAPSDGLLPVF